MKRSKSKKSIKKHESAEKPHPFRMSATSGHLLPMMSLRQSIHDIWQTVTWPVCVKILKSSLALTIALCLLLVDSVRSYAGTSGILASVAVEFVHPAKSYGFLFEDVLLGSIMCCVCASWSLLATYISSLVRDPNDPTLAQPKVCLVLDMFLLSGCFFLSLFRVKVEQANVGGMLAATIMVLSITSAVTNKEFTAVPTLQALVPTLVGFALIFGVSFFVFPENSTNVYVKHLIKTFESFDTIAQGQVNAFLRDGNGKNEPTDSLATIIQKLDTLIANLIEKKRMVRREPSYNVIAPIDISEVTSLVKKLRIPIQGLGISRAMEENMRKHEYEPMSYECMKSTVDVDQSPTPPDSEDSTNANIEEILQGKHTLTKPRSYYGGTDEEEDDSLDESVDESDRCSSPATSTTASSSSSINGSSNNSHSDGHHDRFSHPRKRKVRWEEPMRVVGYWRMDYDQVLNLVKPTYVELQNACTFAITETVKRLRRMQGLDPRFQDLPFFYKYYYRWKVGVEQYAEENRAFEYDSKQDPSIPLFNAIQAFQEHRLIGLKSLYTKSGVPRRILFLLLMFQCNLHAYAEALYTISSFVYEVDQTRTKRKLWMPHMSLTQCFFARRNMIESFELDTPTAIMESANPVSLKKSLARRVTFLTLNNQPAHADLEAQVPVLYRLNTPRRGHLRFTNYGQRKSTASMFHPADHISSWRMNTLDPLDYHDPDVSYPTTKSQRFFHSIYVFFIKSLYTADVAFACRAVVVVALLSLPGFLEDSVHWYNAARGQWAVVVALIWMGSSVGSNFFGTMTRTVGTFIGAIEAILIWEISRATAPGIIVLSFFFNLPWWLVYINGKAWKSAGLFALITLSIITGYTYNFQPNGHAVSVYVITWERTVDVLIGVLAALIISIFPYPRTSRVVLRHRISKTLGELGALYSSFLTLLIRLDADDETNKVNRKLFFSVAESVRAQIKGERILLEQSRFEPTLRGVFPEEKYLHILQILESILSLLLEMAFAFEKISPAWRANILKDTWSDRKTMIASFLTALHLGSNALTSKTPLPPYVLRPTKSRRNLTNKTRRLAALAADHLGEREYTYFSTYLMTSEQLAVEIELLIANIRDLVGPDSVSVWLKYKH